MAQSAKRRAQMCNSISRLTRSHVVLHAPGKLLTTDNLITTNN